LNNFYDFANELYSDLILATIAGLQPISLRSVYTERDRERSLAAFAKEYSQ